MARSGYNAEAIAKMRDRYEQDVPVEDWPGSWDAVTVYQLTDMDLRYAFDGPHFHPPAITEIESAARAAGKEWTAELLYFVKVMAHAACEVHNARIRRK